MQDIVWVVKNMSLCVGEHATFFRGLLSVDEYVKQIFKGDINIPILACRLFASLTSIRASFIGPTTLY